MAPALRHDGVGVLLPGLFSPIFSLAPRRPVDPEPRGLGEDLPSKLVLRRRLRELRAVKFYPAEKVPRVTGLAPRQDAPLRQDLAHPPEFQHGAPGSLRLLELFRDVPERHARHVVLRDFRPLARLRLGLRWEHGGDHPEFVDGRFIDAQERRVDLFDTKSQNPVHVQLVLCRDHSHDLRLRGHRRDEPLGAHHHHLNHDHWRPDMGPDSGDGEPIDHDVGRRQNRVHPDLRQSQLDAQGFRRVKKNLRQSKVLHVAERPLT
mmetsp:Transcript_19633/g.63108  ORF Transcript_19633/g.63108 Transcript_19633/m.63108 type:complete len:262 (-) Transcript_19633:1014-1799(-)